MTCTTTIWQHRNSPFGPESPNRECDIQSISDDVALIPPPPTLYCRQRAQRHFPTFNPRRTDDTMIDTVSAVDQQLLPEQHLLTEQQQLSTATKMAKPPPFPRASDAPMHRVFSSEEHTTHRKLDHKTVALLEAKRDSFASVDSKASTMGGESTGSDALDEDVDDCDMTDVNVGGVWKSRAGSCTTMASLSEVGEESSITAVAFMPATDAEQLTAECDWALEATCDITDAATLSRSSTSSPAWIFLRDDDDDHDVDREHVLAPAPLAPCPESLTNHHINHHTINDDNLEDHFSRNMKSMLESFDAHIEKDLDVSFAAAHECNGSRRVFDFDWKDVTNADAEAKTLMDADDLVPVPPFMACGIRVIVTPPQEDDVVSAEDLHPVPPFTACGIRVMVTPPQEDDDAVPQFAQTSFFDTNVQQQQTIVTADVSPAWISFENETSLHSEVQDAIGAIKSNLSELALAINANRGCASSAPLKAAKRTRTPVWLTRTARKLNSVLHMSRRHLDDDDDFLQEGPDALADRDKLFRYASVADDDNEECDTLEQLHCKIPITINNIPAKFDFNDIINNPSNNNNSPIHQDLIRDINNIKTETKSNGGHDCATVRASLCTRLATVAKEIRQKLGERRWWSPAKRPSLATPTISASVLLRQIGNDHPAPKCTSSAVRVPAENQRRIMQTVTSRRRQWWTRTPKVDDEQGLLGCVRMNDEE